jgi:uncharacterized membrane protein YdjX (TVP38/TMEM64 family)
MQSAPPRADQRREHPIWRLPVMWDPRQPRTATPEARHAPARPGLPPVSPRAIRLAQVTVVLGMAAILALLYAVHPGARAEVGRALAVLATGDGAAVGAYLHGYGVWAPVASLFLMVVQAVAAPVPAVLVAFANGLTFGVVWGGLLTIGGQTLAAVVCFTIARSLGREPVAALAGKLGLATADRWLGRWGARGILLLRLVPGISFDVISYAAGLTGIGFGPFLLATMAGVAPQAFLYAYLIREAPHLAWAFYAVTWLLITVVVATGVVHGRRRAGKRQRARARTASVSFEHSAPFG